MEPGTQYFINPTRPDIGTALSIGHLVPPEDVDDVFKELPAAELRLVRGRWVVTAALGEDSFEQFGRIASKRIRCGLGAMTTHSNAAFGVLMHQAVGHQHRALFAMGDPLAKRFLREIGNSPFSTLFDCQGSGKSLLVETQFSAEFVEQFQARAGSDGHSPDSVWLQAMPAVALTLGSIPSMSSLCSTEVVKRVSVTTLIPGMQDSADAVSATSH